MAKALEIIVDEEKDLVLFTGSTFLLKDEIKALPGARWNGKDKVWFAPSSKNSIADLKIKFPGAIIVSSDGNVAVGGLSAENQEVTAAVADEIDNDYLSVAGLLESVRGVVQRAFPNDIKICGIVRGLKILGNGRLYLDIYDATLSTSHIRSVIWESNSSHIVQLEKEGFKLESELPILVDGKLSFNSLNGSISFIIRKIYPEYTKGKLAAKRDATNLRLREDGIFNFNKERVLPTIPKKLGLLTSQGGTVINDFLASLAIGEFGFELKWLPVRVQGQHALGDLLKGINHFNQFEDLDAIIIFRGGGSVGDLQVFNEYELAKAICLSGKPVLSAVGHEFDQSSVQDVSNLSFGVPKDLGHFLSRRIIDLREFVTRYYEEILRKNREIVLKNSNDISVKMEQIRSRGAILVKETYNLVLQSGLETLRKSSEILSKRDAYLRSSFVSLVRASSSILMLKESHLRENAYNLVSLSRYRCLDFGSTLKKHFSPLYSLSHRIYSDVYKLLANLEAIFKVVSPEMQLERGYAIIKSGSRILTSVKSIDVGGDMEIEMKDGSIHAIAKNIIGR